MPSRSFSTPTNNEPVFFEVDGVRYDCIPLLPAGFGQDILRFGAAKAAEFFDIVLVGDSKDRFEAAIRNPVHPIDQRTFDAITEYLVEVYTGRPTGLSNGSSSGEPPTGLPLTPPVSGRA